MENLTEFIASLSGRQSRFYSSAEVSVSQVKSAWRLKKKLLNGPLSSAALPKNDKNKAAIQLTMNGRPIK